MDIRQLHEWPGTVAEAEAIQRALRPMVDLSDPGPDRVRLAAGLDVAYAERGDRLAAAVVVLDTTDYEVVDQSVVLGTAAFDYVPGLFAFRELPALVTALERLTTVPDLLVCDGQGIAHPRRFGLACHIGVLTGLPAVGVAKTSLVGSYDPPAGERGAWSEIHSDGEVVGRVLRTRTGVKPVFVSVGHRVSLDNACRHVLRLSPHYRLPETTRAADHLSRMALADRAPASLDVP
ncbi:MAG TPA: deoxyribonuclease V [Streptosporangiaceae bacterium]